MKYVVVGVNNNFLMKSSTCYLIIMLNFWQLQYCLYNAYLTDTAKMHIKLVLVITLYLKPTIIFREAPHRTYVNIM